MHRLLALSLFGAALLGASLSAQNDYRFAKATPGVLGAPLTVTYSGNPPGAAILALISLNAGPTPLAVFGDPRSLAVGVDLPDLWQFQLLPGNGRFSWTFPANPALHGVLLHLQSMTVPGAAGFVGKISNKLVAQVGVKGRPAGLPGMLREARALAYSWQLPNGDLQVAGGGSGSITSIKGSDTSEIYGFDLMAPRAGAKMFQSSAIGAWVRLRDGRVLIAGGVDAAGNVLNTSQIFDPRTGKFTASGRMTTPRVGCAGTLLPNGKVLVVGGASKVNNVLAALQTTQKSAEVWDPATGRWTRVADMPDALLVPDVHTTSNGKVIVSGGIRVQIIIIPLPSVVATCREYDFVNNRWKSYPSMKVARAGHLWNTIDLKDGRVLVTGGVTGNNPLNIAAIKAAEILDPRTNTWTRLPDMATERFLGSATLLPDGRVVVAGGARGSFTNPVATSSVQVLDPRTGTWRTLPNLTAPRAAHAAGATPDGVVVLIGGQQDTKTTLKTLETIRP